MKVNGTQGDYLPVSQGLQSDEDETQLGNKSTKVDAALKNGLPERVPIKDVEEGKPSEKSEKAPMSPLRKVCFVLSLLQCALFIIAFGWLIPCKLPRYLENPAKNWDFPLDGYDISTNFGFAKTDKKSGSIIFGYQSPTNSSLRGFVALNALDGSQIWNNTMLDSPASVYCPSDFKSSATSPVSCFIVDKNGQMADIDAASGHIEWFVHNHDHNKTWTTVDLTVPNVGPDCNNDTISDLYFTGIDNKQNMLYIVSGYDGQVLTSVVLDECANLPEKIIPWFEDQDTIIFSCMQSNSLENIWLIPLNNLCNGGFQSTNPISHSATDTKVLASLEKDNSVSKILTVPVANYENVFHQILVTKNGHIIQLLSPEKETGWSYEMPVNLVLKDSVSGRFINATSQNIALLGEDLTNSNITTVIIIDEASGSPLLNYTFANQTATSLYVIPNKPDVKDGLLIRTLSPITEVQNVIKENEQTDLKNSSKAVNSSPITHVEEKFLLLDCSTDVSFETPLVITLDTECGSNGCTPDLYNAAPNVLIADVDGDGRSEVIQTVYVNSNNGNSSNIESKIQLSRLSNSVASCGSCGCS